MEKIQDFFNSLNLGYFNLQTIINILIAILIFNLFFLFREKLSYIIIKAFYLKDKDKKNIKNNAFYKPLKNFFFILGFYLASTFIDIPVDINAFILKIFKCITILLISIGVANCITPKSKIFRKMQLKIDKENAIASLLIKIIRIVIYILAFVIIISELGYNINGLIAGLGLGGLTVALAAQDAAKNLFGGLVIIFDKPFEVGDWIETGKIEGTVEDITLRSTHIRAANDSVMVIPNSTLSNDSIINWSRLNRRRISLNLIISFDTELKAVCDFSNNITKMLEKHNDVLNEDISVHFDEIKENGYKLYIFYYTHNTSYLDYLSVRENVNYKIMQIIEKSAIKLAYPTQTININK